MPKIALAFSLMPDSPLQTIVDWTRQAEDAGFDGVFLTEANNDSLACCLGLALNTKRVMLGTAITNIYLRHPLLLGNEVAALRHFSDGRFILGLGTGHREANGAIGIDMGGPTDPMKKMREVVATLRKSFDGGRTNPRIDGRQPIYLAGVSKPMVRLAGEIADGVIFNFFPPSRVKEAMGEIAEGAAKAGRDPKEVVATLFATAFISDDIEAARRPARTLVSRYGAMRFYGNMLAHVGFEKEMAAIRAAGKDGKAAVAAVSDAMVDATLLVGPEARVRERLAELTAPGVEWAIVFVNPVGEDRASAVKRAMRALRP
ncbi:MAG TPA: LLM class flavin-dependent oxidoreductase [Candidatus Binataceae bacterium]|jgi:5,10-methylenetetrahydromethanopterin reductase|nr:LLM class flavin-dependent oxidoreductase [Candidatus Binataceae bacterium]